MFKCGLLCPNCIHSSPTVPLFCKVWAEAGREEKEGVEEKKEKPIEDNEVERMECESVREGGRN